MEGCRQKQALQDSIMFLQFLSTIKGRREKECEDKDLKQTWWKSQTYILDWNKVEAILWDPAVSHSHRDFQMSHCFLFAISQVENDRAQAPERRNTEGVFHGVHLKCSWLDALSTAKGLFVSWVQRTWQPTRALPPSGSDSDWFSLVRLEGDWDGEQF